MSVAKRIMIQGTMSGVGKSLLCAGLCRIFHEDGFRVAPFKSQNMALNSFITKDGLEMGRAQAVQAFAAGIEPDVRMNPILLKPSSDTGSQVILHGEVQGELSAAEYFRRKKEFVPEIRKAFDSLSEEFDIVVIEGAGSPAEINLKQNDIVNMGLAEMVDAPVLLVGDINRGGVFAQLYGTVALLEPHEQKRIRGLVINQFRGDEQILRPGLQMLEQRVQKPIWGVVPYTDVDLDDEDSVCERLSHHKAEKPLDIAVIRLPRISNFTDFSPLEAHPMLGVRYVSAPHQLGTPDLVILPGTKSTMADLKWLRESGLEASVLRLAGQGVGVLGVCGGYQMLGQTISDPHGTEGGGNMRGVGLLPVETVFETKKTRTRVTASGCGWFEGAFIEGYEIHMGQTCRQAAAPFCVLSDGREEGTMSANIMGTYLHGLFDSAQMAERLVLRLCEQKGITPDTFAAMNYRDYQEREAHRWANVLRKHLNLEQIYAIMEETAHG